MEMVQTTLQHMYAGGLFDHIGYGFCRYSTDRFYLVPHFEKMLYDNALLILAYCKAYELTGRRLYLKIANQTASYLFAEMTDPDGGFYSAQDADSQGEEGKYYIFTPEEIIRLLGEEKGKAFCERFDITKAGNFEGKSIPNLLHAKELEDDRLEPLLSVLREYRRSRAPLHTDDKILTAWNSLAIAALCQLYRRGGNPEHLKAAKRARDFIESRLCRGDMLCVSFRAGKTGAAGFLDEYANYIFALLSLYDATFEHIFLDRAVQLSGKAVEQYYDQTAGGFYLSGPENETLLFRPKECYDGAMPSGNTIMAYNFVRLNALVPEAVPQSLVEGQLSYLAGEAQRHPSGFSMFLMALSDFLEPPLQMTVVTNGEDLRALPRLTPSSAIVRAAGRPSEQDKHLNGETVFYPCRDHRCFPPMNRQKFVEMLKKTQF